MTNWPVAALWRHVAALRAAKGDVAGAAQARRNAVGASAATVVYRNQGGNSLHQHALRLTYTAQERPL